MHILCPHCRNPIELVKLSPHEESSARRAAPAFAWRRSPTTGWERPAGQKLGKFELLERSARGRSARSTRPATRSWTASWPSRCRGRQPGRAAGTRPLPARGAQRRPVAPSGDRAGPRGRPERTACRTWSAIRRGRDAGRSAVGAAAELPRGGANWSPPSPTRLDYAHEQAWFTAT